MRIYPTFALLLACNASVDREGPQGSAGPPGPSGPPGRPGGAVAVDVYVVAAQGAPAEALCDPDDAAIGGGCDWYGAGARMSAPSLRNGESVGWLCAGEDPGAVVTAYVACLTR